MGIHIPIWDAPFSHLIHIGLRRLSHGSPSQENRCKRQTQLGCHSGTHLLPNILRYLLRQSSASSHICRRLFLTARHATCSPAASHAFPFFLAPRHRDRAYLSRPHNTACRPIPAPPTPTYTNRFGVIPRYVQQSGSKDRGPR